jgi:serine/threonine protein phosphatase PrpC
MRMEQRLVALGHKMLNHKPHNSLETFEDVNDPKGFGVESSRNVGTASTAVVVEKKKELQPGDAWILASCGLDAQVREETVDVIV